MFQTLINVILPVFFVIGSGYLTTRLKYFSIDQMEALMKFAQSFAIPCLLFVAIANLDLSTGFNPRLLISFYTGAILCFLAGIFGARWFFNRDWEDSIAIGFCCLFSNSVLLGLPITERAYGSDSLTGNYAIIAFHAPFCYGLGITAMEIAANRGGRGIDTARATLKAMFKNVLILGIVLGFLFNISGLTIPALPVRRFRSLPAPPCPARSLPSVACWSSTAPKATCAPSPMSVPSHFCCIRRWSGYLAARCPCRPICSAPVC